MRSRVTTSTPSGGTGNSAIAFATAFSGVRVGPGVFISSRSFRLMNIERIPQISTIKKNVTTEIVMGDLEPSLGTQKISQTSRTARRMAATINIHRVALAGSSIVERRLLRAIGLAIDC